MILIRLTPAEAADPAVLANIARHFGPTAAMAPVVPVVPNPAPPPPPPAPVDAKGVPWDPRIHSRNQARKLDGTWRQRRGAAREVLAQGKPAPVAPPPPSGPVISSVFALGDTQQSRPQSRKATEARSSRGAGKPPAGVLRHVLR